MRAIRPIYDGCEWMSNILEIDVIDLMVCLFDEVNNAIENMNLTYDEKYELLNKVGEEIRLPEESIYERIFLIDETGFYNGLDSTGIEELIIAYEIARWLHESNYEFRAEIGDDFKYHSYVLGITKTLSKSKDCSNTIKLTVPRTAFNELKIMLSLHWAVVILGWHPTLCRGEENENIIIFGGIIISHSILF